MDHFSSESHDKSNFGLCKTNSNANEKMQMQFHPNEKVQMQFHPNDKMQVQFHPNEKMQIKFNPIQYLDPNLIQQRPLD